MPDLRNMTTEAAEAYRAGWQAAKEQAAALTQHRGDERQVLHDATPSEARQAWGFDKQRDALWYAAGAIRAMEPGE